MDKVAIVSIVYHEKEWQETKRCIEACNVPTVYIERDPPGIGSLSKAINAGFKIAMDHYNPKYVWIVTNCTFSDKMLSELTEYMDKMKYAAIHPCFDSDHPQLKRKINNNGSHDFVETNIAFVEFTSPIVRADIFQKFSLDEQMPYVGMDMDWGYRVRQAGYLLGCYHGDKLGHTYNRYLKQEGVTQQRRKLRAQAVGPTRKRLIELYGRNYAKILGYKGPL